MNQTNNSKIKALEDKIKQLENENEKFRGEIYNYIYILDQLDASIFWKNLKGEYIGCNKYVVKMSGKNSKSDIIGRNDSDFNLPWSSESRDIIKNDFKIISSGRSIEIEETLNCSNGLRTYLNIKKPIKNLKGEINGILGIALDITDRKKLQKKIENQNKQLKKKDKVKKEFIDDFSHDIKVPINALVGRTQLLKILSARSKNDKFVKVSDDIERSCLALDMLFTQMRQIVMHEQFDNKKYYSEFNLLQLVQQEFEIAESSMLPEKFVTIDLTTNKDLDIRVSTDNYKLAQIMRNLLSNAVKYTEQGNINVKGLATKTNDDYIYFEFAVVDTGIGIDDLYKKYIFEKFNRGGIASHYNNKQGMGVGLHMVKNNVDILGGELNFKSFVGRGSEFWVGITLEIVKPI